MLKNLKFLSVIIVVSLITIACNTKKPSLQNIDIHCYTKQVSQIIIDKAAVKKTAINLDKTGDKQFLASHYENAMNCYQQALKIREDSFGTSHLSLAESLSNIATVHEVREEYDKAEDSYLRALNILKKTKKKGQSKFNSFLGYLAAIHDQKSTKNTERELKNIIVAYKQLQDSRNIRAGIALHQMAQIYLNSKQYQKAEKKFKHTLSIVQQHIGIQHPYYAKILQGFAKCLFLTKKKNQAVKLLKKANLILNKYPKKLHTKLYQNQFKVE